MASSHIADTLAPRGPACYRGGMQKRSRMPKDPNQRAHLVGEMATGQAAPEEFSADLAGDEDPLRAAARELGRRGGKKGGPARAAKLTAEQRRRIAQTAARTRWKGTSDQPKPDGATPDSSGHRGDGDGDSGAG